jgi:CLIP-associating protein 1/2
MRNLQKLALFSSEHDVPLASGLDETEGDELERAAAIKVWRDDRLFERIWDGLMRCLQPEQVSCLSSKELLI